MNDLKILFRRATECHEFADFINYEDYGECIGYLKTLQEELPKDYRHYQEVQDAARITINRISIQKDIKYHKFESEDQYINSITLMRSFRTQEALAWKKLETVRLQSSTPVDTEALAEEKKDVFWSNFSNLSLIFIIFFIFFAYRFVSSQNYQKIKWRNILRSFRLNAQAELVQKELSYKSQYQISLFGLRVKDLNENKTNLTETEQAQLNLIYRHMEILEQAFQRDIAENKINVWAGVDLTKAETTRARNAFLLAIGEKVENN